ncbi:hypothetical protein K9U39_15465 [Rhodoblastus acidophilus]|nr:hypothetical protein [Rhodoblastus acidophilus]
MMGFVADRAVVGVIMGIERALIDARAHSLLLGAVLICDGQDDRRRPLPSGGFRFRGGISGGDRQTRPERQNETKTKQLLIENPHGQILRDGRSTAFNAGIAKKFKKNFGVADMQRFFTIMLAVARIGDGRSRE